MRRTKIFACLLAVGLASCGGGGGDSGSGSGSSTRSPVPTQTPIAYSGVTTGAALSATNTGAIASNIVGSSGAAVGGSILAGVSAQGGEPAAEQPTGVVGLASRLASAMRANDIGRGQEGSAKTGATIAQTIPCDSGSITVNGSTNDSTGQGSATVDYIDCRTGSDTINGPAALTIRSYDAARGIITDGTMNFTRVRFTGPGFSADLSGTVDMVISVSSSRETFTQNIVVQNNATGRQLRAEDLVIVNDYDTVTPPSSFFTQSISGRVYDSTHGFVTVSTATAPFTSPWGPLYYSTRSQSFPDWGIINLAGATGTARITALGIDLAKIEVDAGNDGTYETSARVKWSEFGTNMSSDLGDSDGDGMHNSWELARGTNPNSAGDRTSDRDGDGYTNYEEYLAGTNAATNGSVPEAVRRLWVTNVQDLAFDSSTGMIQVFTGSGSGVLLDPVTRELGATFSGATNPTRTNDRTTADGAFTLTPTADPRVYTLTNNTTGVSISVGNVAGTNGGRLTRYGTRGLMFRTVGVNTPGYIYLVESRTLIP